MWRTRLGILLAVYLMLVAAFVLGPNPGPLVGRDVPNANRSEFAARGSTHNGSDEDVAPILKDGLIRDFSVDDLGNIALFIPLGLLFPVTFPRRRRWTIPVGIAISATIELTQLGFLPWRISTVRDVWWNGFGTVCGLCVFLVIDALWQRRASAIARSTIPA